jgi:hypothetical protein
MTPHRYGPLAYAPITRRPRLDAALEQLARAAGWEIVQHFLARQSKCHL